MTILDSEWWEIHLPDKACQCLLCPLLGDRAETQIKSLKILLPSIQEVKKLLVFSISLTHVAGRCEAEECSLSSTFY